MSFGEGNLRERVEDLEEIVFVLTEENEQLKRELVQARMHIRLLQTSENAKIELIAKLNGIALDMYSDILEADECPSPYYVEKYAPALVDAGIDIGDRGMGLVVEGIELCETLSGQDAHSGNDILSERYAKEASDLMGLAGKLGWDVETFHCSDCGRWEFLRVENGLRIGKCPRLGIETGEYGGGSSCRHWED